MPFEYEKFTSNSLQMILAHSKCISSLMQLECTRRFIKRPLFAFFMIHSNDDQFTQNLYQL